MSMLSAVRMGAVDMGPQTGVSVRTANSMSKGIASFVVGIGPTSRAPNAMAAGVHHELRGHSAARQPPPRHGWPLPLPDPASAAGGARRSAGVWVGKVPCDGNVYRHHRRIFPRSK